MLENAIDMALRAHSGQMDEGGMPHIMHALAVMFNVQRILEEHPVEGYTNEEILAAAVLHDVPEDTKITLDVIRVMFGDKVADAVDSVTRREGEFYRDHIYRAKAHPAGRKIKIADNQHNRGRLHLIDPKKEKWRKKLDYKYHITASVLNDTDEPTWEGASFEVKYSDKPDSNLREARYYIADPNGKRIEITKEEADNVRHSFRISN